MRWAGTQETSASPSPCIRSCRKSSARGFAPWQNIFFEEVELDQASIENYIAHPGSSRIDDAVEESLMLSKGTLADTREVWANYGNMSAATMFFLMKSALDRHASGPFLMTAFGPGLTAALVEGEIACA